MASLSFKDKLEDGLVKPFSTKTEKFLLHSSCISSTNPVSAIYISVSKQSCMQAYIHTFTRKSLTVMSDISSILIVISVIGT